MSKLIYLIILISTIFSLKTKFHHFPHMSHPFYPKPKGEHFHNRGPFFRPPFEKKEEIQPEFLEPIWEETHDEYITEQLPEYLILEDQQMNYYPVFEEYEQDNFDYFKPEYYPEEKYDYIDYPYEENLPFFESYQNEEIIPEYVNEDLNDDIVEEIEEEKFINDNRYKRYDFPVFVPPKDFRENKRENNSFKPRHAFGRQH